MGENVVLSNAGLQSLYDSILSQAAERVSQDNFQTDAFFAMPNEDTRRGLTLLLRPSLMVDTNLHPVLAELQKICPDQYVYVRSDWHITVLSIISCFAGFQLSSIDTDSYITVLTAALKSVPPFPIEFHGLCCSSEAIMVQGFFRPGTLDVIRDKIRRAFLDTDLQQTIDSRYVLETAHLTVLRFQKPVADPKRVIDFIQQHRNTPFGTFTVDTLELVGNDWYQRQQHTEPVQTFKLKS